MTKPDFNVGDTIRVKVSYPNGTTVVSEGVVGVTYSSGNAYDSRGEPLFNTFYVANTEVEVLEKAVPPNGTWVRVEDPSNGAVRFGQVFDGKVYYQVITYKNAPTPFSRPLRFYGKWEVVA